MFTTPCFIRNNTKELIDYLICIGHKEIQSISKNKGDKKYIYTFNGKFSKEPLHFIKSISNTIDCGTNIELFKAIGALRDDNYFMQWIVSKKSNNDKYWVFNTSNTISNLGISLGYRKATIDELKEHFKE